MGLFDKLKQGLQRTTQQLKDRFDEIVSLAEVRASARPNTPNTEVPK